ncbi:MAG TPA: hypothetical protein VFF06_12730 [Polyangia bacterium]|nr:hypothetical protein [Polyangia bacterium]
MVEGRAKGSLFVQTRRFVGGDAKWRELLAKLPPADQRVLDEPFASNGWYPVALWNRLMDSFLAREGGPKVTELSRYIAAEDLNIVFKMLLKMGSPEFVLRRTEAIYLRYFDVGQFVALEQEPRKWKLTLEGATTREGAPGPVVCAWGVPGWLTEALVRTGAKGVRVTHARCRFQGAPKCEFSTSW